MAPDADAPDGDDHLDVEAEVGAHLDANPDLAFETRRVRRGTGQRAQQHRAAQAARRRARTRMAMLAVAAVVGLVAFGPMLAGATGPVGDTIAGWFTGDDPEPTTSDVPGNGLASGQPIATAGRASLLVATFDDAADGGAGAGATGLQLLTFDPETGRASVVFVPVSLVTDVPGYGPIQASEAGAFGGAPLLELALENSLGVAIDGTLSMTEQSWGAFFARVGGFELDVREPLSEATLDGSFVRRFEAGPQFLDGPRLAELLVFEVNGESELARFPRAQQVLEGFLASAAMADGGVDPVFADGAPMLSSPTPTVVEAIVRALVGAAGTDDLDVRTLPVTAVGAGEGAYYRIDAERSTEFIDDVFGGVVDGDGATTGVRLEVLNGNGAVGIGANVAARLVPLGHTVVITRNADHFNHAETIVQLHGSSDELLAVGAQIVKTLGTGRVQISTIQSSTVDVTIVVGADFRG